MKIYEEKFRRPGTPLSCHRHGSSDTAKAPPDFSVWKRRWTQDAVEQQILSMEPLGDEERCNIRAQLEYDFLCCPEDHHCEFKCQEHSRLCYKCRIPVCRTCMKILHRNDIVPQGLCNDNWHGFLEAWIYANKITWMEKTVSAPFWTGLTLFTMEKKGGRRHLMKDAMYQHSTRVAFKGQVFSAPMDWNNLQQQLEDMEKTTRISRCLSRVLSSQLVCGSP